MGKRLTALLLILLQSLCSCRGNQRRVPAIRFTHFLYNTTIYENSAAKTYLESRVKMGVHVRDPASEVRYKIISGDTESLFKAEEHVLGDFCFLRIRTKGGSSAILNREVKDRYLLTVKALERGSGAEARARVRVQVLDTNDLRPLFSPTSYSVHLPENTAVRSSVARVTATDADVGTNGEYYYSFRDWTDVFAVHPTSGVVTLASRLDYSETRLYELEVLAVDRGLKLYGSSGVSSTAKLTVRVEQANEHAPVIAAVASGPAPTDRDPTYAIVTVDDGDQGANGEIASLSIVAGDPLQQFKTVRTSPGSKEYKIKASHGVDWDGQPYGYNLTLQAKDKGSPPQFSAVKVIHVTPPQLKLPPPEFEKSLYQVKLSEFAPPHTPVVMVRAVPKHPHIKYILKHKTEKNMFTLNPETGLITTAGRLQAEDASKFELEVGTSDGSAATKVVVDVIDTNNNAPEFLQASYKASVDEHVPIGTEVLTVSARDADGGENGFVTYSVASGNPHPFAVDHFTGVVSTARDLDYELMPRIYSLRVRASDWGSPFRREAEASVTVTLNNLNDNEPLFESVDCRAAVPRDLAADKPVATVSAIDADELQLVRYEIKSGNDRRLFDLNPNSGVLSLQRSLGDGQGPQLYFHSLQITASDGEYVTPPMIMNITVGAPGTGVHLKCVDTGVAKMLAKKLLQGTNIHSHMEPENNFIDVHSVNRHAPQLKDTFPGVIDVKEDLPVGARVALIDATDPDSGFNGKLVFVISGGDTESRFVIEMDTGWLKVHAPLDRETTSHYTLNITVYDLGIPQKSISRLLDVNIIDSNDNSPEFLQDSYSVTISEDAAVGTDIIQVEATDKDLGVNGKVRYSLVANTDMFSIDKETGVVKVKSPLDREAHPVLVLKVAARDQAADEPQLVSTVSLRVTLEDVNDNPPRFFPPKYRVRVREDLPVGTVVAWLEAHDPDDGHSGQVRYGLADGGDGDFVVDKLSGAVRIARSLDYETKQVYNLTARAKDKGRPVSLSSTACVELEVVDVNENLYRPWFPSFAVKGSVKEDAAIGASVMRVTAKDEDKGRDGEIRYSIRDGSGLGIFTIDEESGVIRTEELLDHETAPHYWLTVYATDRGAVPLSSFVEVFVEVEDVNDNAPQTSEPVYYPSVAENSPKDVSVIRVEAFDPDTRSGDRLSYRITSGNPQGFFAINPKTGLVTTTSRRLDREQQEEHILEITVTDDGVPPKSAAVRVIVAVLDENDNEPRFLEKVYKIKLPERGAGEREGEREGEGGTAAGVAAGGPVYRVVASDRDKGPNAEISYSLEAGDERGKFLIEPETGLVSTNKFSSAGEYDILSIKAVDNGYPQKSASCRLHIEWIPRPTPSARPLNFDESSFSFSVMESDPVSHMVGVVTTEPTDTPVWFEITGDTQAKEMFHIVQMACDLNCTAEGGNFDSRFDVDKGSGTIIVARPLDAEQKSNYNLTVEATDGTNSVSTQVSVRVIDTNNHRPLFSQPKYQIGVPEDTPPGTEILRLDASDGDEKDKMAYTLLSSTDPFSLRKFRLDPGTGRLYTAESLDHETMRRHTLTVMVRDQDVPVKRNLARVIVNVGDANDNAPRFTSTSYSARVLASAAPGSLVLQVTARDKDKGQNAEILYTIESGNVGNSFAIDPVLGTVTVAKELDGDSEFELVVRASDKGLPPLSALTTARVAVAASDNARPEFAERELWAEVSEAAAAGSFVSVVAAASRSSVSYRIREGNANGAFDINPASGVVVTRGALDYETRPQYRLTVQGTDMAGMASNATLLVRLVDENDNAPVFARAEFAGVVSESAPPNSVVLTRDQTPLVVRASDADQDLNARLVYEIVEPSARRYFAVDSGTGAVRTVAGLDYEQRNGFRFAVQVHDLGTPRLFAETAANVTVRVLDVNDCPPRFGRDLYEASILAPTYRGVKVITVNATDADSGGRSELLFSISKGNEGARFRMDPVSGAILVENATQLRGGYELTLRVSDGRFVGTATVRITVRENKNGTVRFTQDSYAARVPEHSSEKRTLAVVAVLGSPINEPLFYAILNPDRRFAIGRTSGVLSTTGVPFDREEQDEFDVVVEAAKEQQSSGFAHVLVKVTVEDVNDNRPVFVNLPYPVSQVQREAAVGHVIRQVTAVDRDTGTNGEVHYSLRDHQEYFNISSSGEIYLKKPFELDVLSSEFVINVEAEDGGEPSLSSTVEVKVAVVDKAVPVFEKPFYSIEIPENVQLRAPVVHVQASGSEGPHVGYSISEGDPFRQFSIDFSTGVLHVVQPLDYETHPAYKLSVRATDLLTGAHAEVFVDIILEDVNDNPPVFGAEVYAASLSEASVIGTSVLRVTASDADSGGTGALFYQLVEDGGENFDCFGIDRDSGVIWTACALDREETARHKLVVRAVDDGVPALSSDAAVLIDVTDLNDNAPVFTHRAYEASVSELAPGGHFVTRVQASDADSSDAGKLEYSLLSGNEDGSFAIDGKSGLITVSTHRRTPMLPLYNLNVSVSDGVFRSSAAVRLRVVGANSHGPAFPQTDYVVELSESAPAGTLVAEIKATDEDAGTFGRVAYYIVSGFAKEKFSVNEAGQIFTVERVDRERPTEKIIPISLMAKDGGGKVAFCTVSVVLTDVNDNAPEFLAVEYRASVASDVPRGTIVVKITATDMDEGSNADVTYSIQADDGGNIEENFEIHPFSGVVITKESLTGLENDLCVFYVRAKDAGNPARHSVVPVSVKVLPPEVPVLKFVEPHYRFTVAEDLPIGSEIGVIQAESEHAVVYSLVKGNTLEGNRDEVFVIDRDTGTLKLEKGLDYETTKWYQLTLLAQISYEGDDITTAMDINILIKDVNDNRPQFESDPYEAFVAENLPEGTLVIPVKAVDLDAGSNGLVSYSLDQNQETEDIAELFAVDSETGRVTTLRPLDRETRSAYAVAVVATDLGEEGRLSASATVRVTVADANDCPPRFTAELYRGTVSEDDPLPSGVVAILSTTDADSDEVNRQVSYYITDGDPLGQFGIEHVQKDWKVSVRKPLDREERDNYLLNITATDGTFVARGAVEVKVLDANDNSPVCGKTLYAETVPEDAPPGQLILEISATDADIRSNAEISYKLFGAGAELFSLDSHTGELRTLLPLDREERDAYELRARALDGGGRHCESRVRIAVGDVNDNAPRFASETFAVSVFQDTEVHTFVARLQASDADLGSNGDILYSFVDSADGRFSIDERSGIISLEKPLDRRARAAFTLRAQAVDQGAPRRLSSACAVAVSVLDVGDAPPAFERREYAAAVPEDVAAGTLVLRVFAVARDAQPKAEVSYAVVAGNEGGAFSVDSRTGDIFVIGSLDYESTREYYLTVEATDARTPSLSDAATVTINVTDVNDNSPAFSQSAYAAVVGEDCDPGKTVVAVVAEDADGPPGNRVRYSIVGGNQGGPFTIDAVKGEVKVARQLDREKISGYTLTVQASDSGSPPKSSSATVNIDVSDVNDNPPVFSQANYSLVVQETRPVGTVVLQLAVTDRDASHNGPPFSFTIVGGNEGNAFQIDQEGALLTAARLDRKRTEHYSLRVEVADSGKPPLVSSAPVSVRVIEESVYPPAVLPLDVFVTTQGEGYAGGVLGKIHATDQDVYDTLTYSLAPGSRGPFAVSPGDGRLVAAGPLDEGRYALNVTVTDGRFAAWAPVSVHVRRVTRRALDGSVGVRLAGVTPEEFVGDHWRDFLRALRGAAGLRRADVLVVSLQPVGPPAALDVLLALSGGPAHSGAAAVFRKLNASAGVVEEMTGLRVVRVVDKLCAGLDCPRRFCDEVIALDTGAMATHSAARLSFVTPRHRRSAVCLCKGGKCPVLDTLCEGHPCPEESVCIPNQQEATYTCACPDGKPGKCSAGPSLTFGGEGYVKYRLTENDNKEELKLSLRLRTFSSHATLMYARGTDYSILEVQNGRLQYRFDCGSGPGLVSVHSVQLNDGAWHSVSLEVSGNYARLALDGLHAASGTAPGTLRTLNLDDAIFFGGGHVRQLALGQGGRRGRSPPVAGGFRGCMRALVLNGQELPLSAKSHAHSHAHAALADAVGVSPGCAMAPPLGCHGNPCTNGGTCSSLPDGGYFCACSALFMGPRCEIGKTPCASNPCLYGGTCVPRGGDFYCQCRGQYSGQRCQLGPYCKDSPCKNSGKCIESLDGPVCECEQGFQGDRCLGDVDECLGGPCANGGRCENTYGSYRCNCSRGFGGKLCQLESAVGNQLVSTPWNIGAEEVVGIVVFVLSVFVLALLFVVARRRCSRPGGKPEPEEDKHRLGNAFLRGPYLDPRVSRNIYSDVPPQVPVRPASYTPSVPSDSRNNLDRNSFEGSVIPEHPEFSTFSRDPARSHRKPVIVCSVAPNLPPPSFPASDSDSVRKPAWDYEYDANVVELDPCPKKKPSKDNNTCQRISDVHSLGSFQSEAYDDNGYLWDTSDWMPSVHLPGIQEFPQYGPVGSPTPLYSDPTNLDTDYYPGGYDFESDVLPPPKDFPARDELPSLPERGAQYGPLPPPREVSSPPSPCSSPLHSQQLYSLHQYLPQYQYPTDPPQTRHPSAGVKGHGVSFLTYPLGGGRGLGAPDADVCASAACSSDASDITASDRESVEEEEEEEEERGHVATPSSAPSLTPKNSTTQHTQV
ncbi:protocadherin Fat 1-like isoform X1 [Anguilla rostrata]|uniref:protocadherin Fat 1-like isoform X1 n=1 Tax=Anguilla rostrata TaxID=7938 RepID=UPI0030CD1965